MDTDQQFAAVNGAVDEAADAVASQLQKLMAVTARHDRVARDYVIERFLETLLIKHPDFVAWLDYQQGEGSMRLSAALQDWLDLRATR